MNQKSRGNRGKQLESEVRSYLKERSKTKEFTFYRLPDARTCGGRLKAQPGDFFIFKKGQYPLVIDPKELKSGMRLNIKNRCSQLPKMNRLGMAGVSGYFIIYQMETDTYYVCTSVHVQELKDEGQKSINLKNLIPHKSVEEVMELIC